MDPNGLMLTQDAFNAHMLRGVMETTRQPGETAPDMQTRCAAIVEIFRTFEAANPLEAMIACQCISLRFLLDAAMRDAGAADLAPALVIRMRASAMTISKSLHLWMTEFGSLHARNEARAGEISRLAVAPLATPKPEKSQLAPAELPPLRTGLPHPIAAKPLSSPAPFVATPFVAAPFVAAPFVVAASGAQRSGFPPGSANLPAHGMKESLLSSVASTPVAWPAIASTPIA